MDDAATRRTRILTPRCDSMMRWIVGGWRERAVADSARAMCAGDSP
jgi:hypothetical protein